MASSKDIRRLVVCASGSEAWELMTGPSAMPDEAFVVIGSAMYGSRYSEISFTPAALAIVNQAKHTVEWVGVAECRVEQPAQEES